MPLDKTPKGKPINESFIDLAAEKNSKNLLQQLMNMYLAQIMPYICLGIYAQSRQKFVSIYV